MHAAAAVVVRVPSAPHSHTRLTYFFRCVHAFGLELFYLVFVLCTGQGRGAGRCCYCARAFSTSLPHPLGLFFLLRARVWVGIILSRLCFVYGTGAWCTPLLLLLCVCLQHLTPTPALDVFFLLRARVRVGIILSRLRFVYGTEAWCTPLLLLCVCLQHLTPTPACLIFSVACTRLGWNYFISFVFCVRDRGLMHAAAAVVRVPSAPHSHTRA